MRADRNLTIGRTTLSVREWSRRSRVPYTTLLWRIDHGWPEERLFKPSKPFLPGMKDCGGCGETKPLEAFYARSGGGVLSECKVCFNRRKKV